MILVEETTSAQKLRFIPRKSTSGYYTIEITAEYRNKVIYSKRTALIDESYFQTLTDTFDFKANEHYTMTVTSDDTPYFLRVNADSGTYEPLCEFDADIDELKRPIVFKGRLYCTTEEQEFVSHATTENEFVYHE